MNTYEKAKTAYSYAFNVLHARNEAGEDDISKDAKISCLYAKNVIKGRFHAGESAMLKHKIWGKVYNKDVMRGKWKAYNLLNAPKDLNPAKVVMAKTQSAYVPKVPAPKVTAPKKQGFFSKMGLSKNIKGSSRLRPSKR